MQGKAEALAGEVKQLDDQLARAEAEKTPENAFMSPEEHMVLKREQAVMQEEVGFGSAAHAAKKTLLVHFTLLLQQCRAAAYQMMDTELLADHCRWDYCWRSKQDMKQYWQQRRPSTASLPK